MSTPNRIYLRYRTDAKSAWSIMTSNPDNPDNRAYVLQLAKDQGLRSPELELEVLCDTVTTTVLKRIGPAYDPQPAPAAAPTCGFC